MRWVLFYSPACVSMWRRSSSRWRESSSKQVLAHSSSLSASRLWSPFLLLRVLSRACMPMRSNSSPCAGRRVHSLACMSMRRRARPCASIRVHALQCVPMRLLVGPIIGGIRWPVASAAGNLESSLSWLIHVIVSYVALVLVLLGSGGEVHHPSVSRWVNLSQSSGQLHQRRVRDRVSDRVRVRNRVRDRDRLGGELLHQRRFIVTIYSAAYNISHI